MTKIRKLTVTLVTGRKDDAGTDATLILDFLQHAPIKSLPMPNLPDNENESGMTTIYPILNPNLNLEDFMPNFVQLRNDNTHNKPGWFCRAVFINAIDINNRTYSLVSMDNVNRWLAQDEPGGLTMELQINSSFGLLNVSNILDTASSIKTLSEQLVNNLSNLSDEDTHEWKENTLLNKNRGV